LVRNASAVGARCRTGIVLAAGRGTRMQRPWSGLQLTAEQSRWADEGVKALVPFHGWPFIAYTLSALGASGIDEVCIVVRPGRDPVRSVVEQLATRRLRVSWAEQAVARGTADALRSVESLVGAADFLVVNGDNYYSPATLTRMALAPIPSMAGFRPSTIAAARPDGTARLAHYALARADTRGRLVGFVEKPAVDARVVAARRTYVSMQCWRLDAAVFDACRTLPPSPRGEFELPDAVLAAAAATNRPVRVVPVDEDVLDLSTRQDIPLVERALADVEVAL